MIKFLRFLVEPIGGVGVFLIVALIFCLPYSMERPRKRGRPLCVSNLHNIAVGLQNYAYVNDGLLLAPVSGPHNESWRVLLLPMMDHVAMYRAYHHDKPWHDPANQEFARTKIPYFTCPENPTPRDAQGRYYTAYALLTGPGTAYDQPMSRKLDDLPNGQTQTILAVEACGANIVWNEPRDLDVIRDRILVGSRDEPIQTAGGWVSRQHKDYVNVVFADGSTRTLSLTIDPEVLKAMTSVDPANKSKNKTSP